MSLTLKGTVALAEGESLEGMINAVVAKAYAPADFPGQNSPAPTSGFSSLFFDASQQKWTTTTLSYPQTGALKVGVWITYKKTAPRSSDDITV